jgi:hypothetical protein
MGDAFVDRRLKLLGHCSVGRGRQEYTHHLQDDAQSTIQVRCAFSFVFVHGIYRVYHCPLSIRIARWRFVFMNFNVHCLFKMVLICVILSSSYSCFRRQPSYAKFILRITLSFNALWMKCLEYGIALGSCSCLIF